MKFIMGALFGVLSTIGAYRNCHAAEGDLWIGVDAVAIHDHESHGKIPYNERNESLALIYETKHNIRVDVGFFKNSAYRDSFYGGAGWWPEEARYGILRAGVFAGAVTGYANHPFPIAGPIFAAEWRQLGVDFVAIPTKVYIWRMKFKFD